MGVGRLVLTVVALLTVAGCGAAGDRPAPPVATSAESSAGDELVVVVDGGPGGPQTWRLTCDPVGGTHPDPAAACRALDLHAAALAPVPKDRLCSQRYGGPQTATVTGTWRGRRIEARLSLTDGCEISRWTALEGLLPPAGSGSGA